MTTYFSGIKQTENAMNFYLHNTEFNARNNFQKKDDAEKSFQNRNSQNANKKYQNTDIQKKRKKNKFGLNFFIETLKPNNFSRLPLRNIFLLNFNEQKNAFNTKSPFSLRFTVEEIEYLEKESFNLDNNTSPKYLFTDFGIFLYLKNKNSTGFSIVFADYTRDLQRTLNLLVLSIFVYIFALLFSVLIAWFVASRAVKPVKDAFNAQKQFIADASHELKTPVAVISANVDVLAEDIGENKWLNYIKNENKRMASLVTDLLYLAKNDAGRIPYVFEEFDLSRTIEASVLPFESIIFEQNKKLELNVQKSIMYVGDQQKIAQVIAILLDNAIKNSWEGAKISVSVICDFTKKNAYPSITVFNEGYGLNKVEIEKIFQRFYRSDSSRTRETGGSGLGLSIAQSIATVHNGSIVVESKEDEWISFTFKLGKYSKRK